ncbi:hypothetical protein Btru_035368 [Bulinus truncatus]|nr:hypothetical protein Btru_035368 [Bulinus truncatus]
MVSKLDERFAFKFEENDEIIPLSGFYFHYCICSRRYRRVVFVMDEGRLGAARRGSRHIRKVTHVLNEIIKSRQILYQHCISREHQESSTKLITQLVQARKEVVKKRVLLQCLTMKKETFVASSEKSLMGSYAGRPLVAFSRDVDQKIAWNHPNLRRHRYVDRVKQNCLDNGDILSEDETKEKIERFFVKLREDEEVKALARQRQKNVSKKKKLRRLGGLLVNDEDAPRVGDFPDPFGTVKKVYDENPFEKLANLRPNYYKVNLLRGGRSDTPASNVNKSFFKEKTDLNTFLEVQEKSNVYKYQIPLPHIQSENKPLALVAAMLK